jgi:predicted nuclease of predicted toxin-antitoxin system
MFFLADECVDAAVVEGLRDAGHDVRYVAEGERALTDAEVLKIAAQENRILLTEDKDFGDLVFRGGYVVPGVVLLRIEPLRRSLKWPRLAAAIERFEDRLFGRHTVVHEDRFRFRAVRSRR